MRKEELDDQEEPTLWTVPTERTKTNKRREHEGRVYLVPLPPLASEILKPLLKAEGDLAFPSRREGKPMDCGSKFMAKVRDASQVKDWHSHAHRHTISTWLQNQGHDEYDRGLVLNHAGSGSVTSGYSHGYSLARKRVLMEKWADHVSAITESEGTAPLGC